MGFIAKDSGGGDFKKVPPGVYIGRCFSLVDLGTQHTSGQFGDKLQHKIHGNCSGKMNKATRLRLKLKARPCR